MKKVTKKGWITYEFKKNSIILFIFELVVRIYFFFSSHNISIYKNSIFLNLLVVGGN
jgi:hypothetical protein